MGDSTANHSCAAVVVSICGISCDIIKSMAKHGGFDSKS
jgi:hypothetical protein